jgi:hypothetical protein
MMIILQNIFLITVPLSTLLTTIAILMPYWWSSETLQVGLWRARSISSSWLLVEPQVETEDGKKIKFYLIKNKFFCFHLRSYFIYSTNSFIYFCFII